MKPTLQDRLLQRELGNPTRYSKVRGLYADHQFLNDLDIVNELNGHKGCVNALSWSRSGRLLASGSDDKVVNIYSYLPEVSNNQFELVTQIDTGHSRNIFSVKFMPHSNDRTIVTAAGDAQVRVFDLERSVAADGTRTRLSQSQANGKTYRSHSQAVKRIVTEASPFYFLSCAEDGDVRQWDIRQPDSAYPRQPSRYHNHYGDQSRDNVPPPLISYHDYHIDLMTISCSPSQPHYIALGGTHLHCFLHDRRMLGRDKLKERGGLLASDDDDGLEAATRCVRKFAPHGQPKMQRSDPKSITACKISDANPNELIVSWNGDFIYSFDILRDEESSKLKEHPGMTQGSSGGRVKQQKDRKRKRMHAASRGNSQEADSRADSRQRTQSAGSEGQQQSQEVSLLFRMENGESVEIPIPSTALPELSVVRAPSSDHANKNGIAEQVRLVRNTLMNSGRGLNAMQDTEIPPDDTLEIRSRMDRVLASALKLLEKLDGAISNWTYPVTGSTAVIAFQRKLREDRAKTWRFIQACGTVARVVLRRPIDSGPRKVLEYFDIIHPAPRESATQLERHEHFGYDFIKAVLLWLDSGVGAVLREFTHDPDDPNRSYRRRRPILKDSGIDAIDALLIPYLSGLASSEIAITDIDADDFENSFSFSTEKDAVAALSRAMKIPFADLAGRAAERNARGEPIAQDRETAVKFWAHRVCRAVLRNAAIDVTYALVDTAFGTLSSSDEHTSHTAAPSRSSDGREEDQEAAPADTDADEVEEDEDEDEDEDDDNESSTESSDDSDEDEDQEDTFFIPHPNSNSRPRHPAGKGVPTSSHTRLYRGHCNVETTKDVNFWGLQDEYVVSGSDCGNLFIWDRKTCELLNILEGDNEVVNVIQGHPYEPMLAVSGIDHTVKIFSPDARARKDAAMGIGIQPSDHSTFSSIGLRRRRETLHQRMNMRPPSQAQAATGTSSPPSQTQTKDATSEESYASPNPSVLALPNDDDDPDPTFETMASITSSSGLASRKQMQNSYQIVSRNDMDRRRGARQGAFITRGMMQLLAQQFRAQLAGQVEGANLAMGEDGEGGGDGEMEAEEGCAVM